MIHTVVQETNLNATRKQQAGRNDPNWIETDFAEMSAYLGYCHEFDVYLGKGSTPNNGKGLSYNVITKLTEELRGKYHHVYFDSFFTSIPLATNLLQNGIYMCGTIRKNRRQFPEELKNLPVRLEQGQYVGRQCGNLVAVVWMDNRHVSVLSTNQSIEQKNDPIIPYFKNLDKKVGTRIYRFKIGGASKFWKTTEKVDGNKYIHLHCDIDSYYINMVDVMGIVIKIKQIGKSYYKPIVSVTGHGQIYWSQQRDWKKKYTTTKKDTVRLTMIKRRKRLKKLTLVVPGENCGKERGLYRCLFYVKNRTNRVSRRNEKTLDLSSLQCKNAPKKIKIKPVKKTPSKKTKTHRGGRIDKKKTALTRNVNVPRRKSGSNVVQEKNDTSGSLAAGLIIGFLIVLFTALAVYYLWYKKRKETQTDDKDNVFCQWFKKLKKLLTDDKDKVQHPRQTRKKKHPRQTRKNEHPRQTTKNKPPNNRPTRGEPARTRIPHQRERTQQRSKRRRPIDQVQRSPNPTGKIGTDQINKDATRPQYSKQHSSTGSSPTP